MQNVTVTDNFLYEYDINVTKGSFLTLRRFYGAVNLINVEISNYLGTLLLLIFNLNLLIKPYIIGLMNSYFVNNDIVLPTIAEKPNPIVYK